MEAHPVGIDVSAKELVVTSDRSRDARFDNDAAGHKKLIRFLTKGRRAARVVLEATGVYSLDLALALHRAPRIEVMVANPRAVANFAKAYLQRSKTDPLDAEVLLEFARRMPFTPWWPRRRNTSICGPFPDGSRRLPRPPSRRRTGCMRPLNAAR
jgi:transposase